MNAAPSYVAIDLTDPANPVYVFLSGKDLISFMDDAHKNGRKIKIHGLTAPIVDWTQ